MAAQLKLQFFEYKKVLLPRLTAEKFFSLTEYDKAKQVLEEFNTKSLEDRSGDTTSYIVAKGPFLVE